jgi:uncharacterized protein YaaR (DUF327 family)
MALKVDGNSERKPQNITGRVDRDVNRVHGKEGLQFSTQLDKHFSEGQDEELRKKAKEIEKQGKRLSEHIDISELKAYKRLQGIFRRGFDGVNTLFKRKLS